LAIGPPIQPRAFPRMPHSPFVTAFHARRLPHYHAVGQPIFLTLRLHGSLPYNCCFPSAATSDQAFLCMGRLLDNARKAIRYRDEHLAHYLLRAYVAVSNHVHLLITPRVQLSKLTQPPADTASRPLSPRASVRASRPSDRRCGTGSYS